MNKGKDIKVDFSGIRNAIVNYIVPLVALVLSLLIGIFVLRPSYVELPQVETELESKTQLNSNLQSKLQSLNELVDFKSSVDENSDLVNRVLVSEQLVPGLLTQVDRIARESGLTITRLNYGAGSTAAAVGGGDYQSVTINLGVRGSFEQLKTFLLSVENAARIISVDSVRYTLNEDDQGIYLGVTFVLSSPYYYVESNAVTDEPIPLNIGDPKFTGLINKIKNMKYYDPNEVNVEVPVIEATEEVTEEVTPETAPETAPETPAEEPAPQNDSIFL